MVTIITEKLRNQTLDDAQFEPIPLPTTRRSWELTASGWGSSSHYSGGKKDWVLSHHGVAEYWRHPGGEVPGKAAAELRTSTSPLYGHSDRHRIASGPVPITLDPPPLCAHNKSFSSCLLCSQDLPNTPPAPPSKRHCRSLSIPGDGKCAGGSSAARHRWQPQPSAIWRPVAVRPHHVANNKLLKNRNSPLGLHKSKGNSSSPLGHVPAGAASANKSQSPGVGVWSLSSSDSCSTPPESPIPRPHSASSGFYDSSQGSLYSPWLDVSDHCSSQKYDVLKVRSLSMEEPISKADRPNSAAISANAASTGSMPALPNPTASSTPSSPRRQRVPRCRSQPCVLHERKCGVKRRRGCEERPTLDFFKMKETAYDIRNCNGGRGATSSRQKNVQFATEQEARLRMTPSIFSEPPECFLGLNTIASSPLDSTPNHFIAMTTATSTLLSSPPAKYSPPPDGRALHPSQQQLQLLHTAESSSTLTLSRVASDSTVTGSIDRDDLSDSGGSYTNDGPPDIGAFVDSEENNGCCGDYNEFAPPPSGTANSADDEEDPREEALFQMDLIGELDLEQIEKD